MHSSNLMIFQTGRFFSQLSYRCLLKRSINMAASIPIPERYRGTETNVWVEFGALAAKHQAVNLGQGFPDYPVPDYIREALATVMKSDNPLLQQYTRSFGHVRLVNVLAKLYNQFMPGKNIDPMENILVTVGAYGSLYANINGLIQSGDEAIIIEPFFDCYAPMVKVAGGVPKFIPLRPTKSAGEAITSDDWKLDKDELAKMFTDKTKIIILNTPNNPIGKVYKKDELEYIASLCIKHNVICVSDEVYEWLIYPGNEHLRIATLPGMWERTITIGSAGKTFSLTGWKIGWSIAPAGILKPAKVVHQNCNYTCATPIQEALAICFEREIARIGQPTSYWKELQAELLEERDELTKILKEVGFNPTIPEGGYFMMADWSQLPNFDSNQFKADEHEGKDSKFAKWLISEKKLALIPPSAFYCKEHWNLAANYVRFCFFKKAETFAKTRQILAEWLGKK